MTTLYAPADVLYERMLTRVELSPSGCWVFTGAVNSRGYGIVSAGARGKTVLAHRLALIATSGEPIAEGMTVDHTCHDSYVCTAGILCPHRRCVTVEHMGVVTIRENSTRKWDRGTCRKGHALTPRADRGRSCAECARDYSAARRAAARNPPPGEPEVRQAGPLRPLPGLLAHAS